MNEIIGWAFFALPWVVALVVPFLFFTWVVVGSRAPWAWVCLYFAFLFFFPNASWGLVEPGGGNNFYTRGTGYLYFSAVNVLLFCLVGLSWLHRRLNGFVRVDHNLHWEAIAFGLIMFGNVVVSFALPDVRWFDLLAPSGLMNLVNFMFAFYVLVSTLGERKDLDRFLQVLVACTVLRGLWGVARFVALGGDPANFYSNFQKIDVKLTFFDINDSLLATVTLFIAAWQWFKSENLPSRQRLFYGFVIALELFIIVFSYRRTAWAGLGLAALLFAFNMKRSVRVRLLLVYVFAGMPLIAYKMLQRGTTPTRGLSLLERMFPDVTTSSHGGIDFTTGRFAELYAAFLSVKESPIWGLGAWGRYSDFRFSDLAWHHGNLGWMHSAVLHIMLKTGLIGVVVMTAAYVGYFRYAARMRPQLPERERGLLLAGVAGMLFMLPNWFFGTPLIEYRTMQLTALVAALPYLATAVARRGAEPR